MNIKHLFIWLSFFLLAGCGGSSTEAATSSQETTTSSQEAFGQSSFGTAKFN
jgi:uncharacterized lipoprotein YajG